MGLPSTASFTAARDSSEYTTPVGLLGELRTMALVFSLTHRERASRVIWKSVLEVSRGIIVAPAMVMMLSYRGNAGVGTITSSPGFKMPSSAVNSAPEAPTVTNTCSGEQA